MAYRYDRDRTEQRERASEHASSTFMPPDPRVRNISMHQRAPPRYQEGQHQKHMNGGPLYSTSHETTSKKQEHYSKHDSHHSYRTSRMSNHNYPPRGNTANFDAHRDDTRHPSTEATPPRQGSGYNTGHSYYREGAEKISPRVQEEEQQRWDDRMKDFLPPKDAKQRLTTPAPYRPNGSSSNKRNHSGFPRSFNSKSDGPQLISHQSSDESSRGHSAFAPPKRQRIGPSESSSFHTHSPIHGLASSFSREDFEPPRTNHNTNQRSGQDIPIFHSWSSGPSRSRSQSPSDVQGCYDDWNVSSRRSDPSRQMTLASSRSWADEITLVPSRTDGFMNSPLEAHPSSSFSESHRDRSNSMAKSSSHPPHHQQASGEGNRTSGSEIGWPQQYDNIKPYPVRYSSTHTKHGDQYHDNGQYSRSSYGKHEDSHYRPHNRPYDGKDNYWRDQHHYNQRRDDIEDKTKLSGPPRSHSPVPRRSVPTPPVRNGWGRYPMNYDQNRLHNERRSDMHHQEWNNERYTGYQGGGRHPQYHPGSGMMKNNHGMRYDEPMCLPTNSPPEHLRDLKHESLPNGRTFLKTQDNRMLLAQSDDRISLSETLCIVRENIEVFTATEDDVKAPAPGRKRPVSLHQVGLRCYHCRFANLQNDRVKRAVCFPSSIKRIYRTVIDMKLDHFKSCRYVPLELKRKLEELKATNARSTGTTMQYFVAAAKKLGMADGEHGIVIIPDDKHVDSSDAVSAPDRTLSVDSVGETSTGTTKDSTAIMKKDSGKTLSTVSTFNSDTSPDGVRSDLSLNLKVDPGAKGTVNCNSSNEKSYQDGKDGTEYFNGKILLALMEDKSALSPLRCFLRQNVYAFSATEEDIAVRTPTTFSVVLGQVGIGCIHCLSLPAKERSNRAVCFPFSIARIYQSVADIQRFHLGECKHVPEDIRKKFDELQSQSSKGSKGLATRQYWITSAKKIGLVDTKRGIRFERDPVAPLEKAPSLDILARVATDAKIPKQLVLPEDEPHIAEFLFLVMKQLQPCRFTEADRNKRRLKDVGCTGVECKHCAGQVDGRKFFWSSVNAVESNFVSVHTHMMECKMISQDLKDKLAETKKLRKEQTSRLKTGSQKAFFARVWERLHSGSDSKVPNSPPGKGGRKVSSKKSPGKSASAQKSPLRSYPKQSIMPPQYTPSPRSALANVPHYTSNRSPYSQGYPDEMRFHDIPVSFSNDNMLTKSIMSHGTMSDNIAFDTQHSPRPQSSFDITFADTPLSPSRANVSRIDLSKLDLDFPSPVDHNIGTGIEPGSGPLPFRRSPELSKKSPFRKPQMHHTESRSDIPSRQTTLPSNDKTTGPQSTIVTATPDESMNKKIPERTHSMEDTNSVSLRHEIVDTPDKMKERHHTCDSSSFDMPIEFRNTPGSPVRDVRAKEGPSPVSPTNSPGKQSPLGKQEAV